MTCWHSFPELKGEVLRSVWSSRLSMVLYGKGESGEYWSLQDPQFLGSWPVGEGKTEVLSLQFHWFPPCSDPLWPYRSGKRWITTSQADSNALLWQLCLAGSQPTWQHLERASDCTLITGSLAIASPLEGASLAYTESLQHLSSEPDLFHLL